MVSPRPFQLFSTDFRILISDRWNNTTYIAFGLSIILSSFAQEPAGKRASSPDLPYIEQALEMLEVMSECSVARNISIFVRELLEMLLTPCDPHVNHADEVDAALGQLDSSLGLEAGTGDHPGGFNADLITFNFFDDIFPASLDGTQHGFQDSTRAWV
jgi:hypothetical protein